MNEDLTLVSTDDLIDELQSRCDAMVLVYRKDIDQNIDQTYCNCWGGKGVALGLLEYGKLKVSRDITRDMDRNEE